MTPRHPTQSESWFFALMFAIIVTIGVMVLTGCNSNPKAPETEGLQRAGEGVAALKSDHKTIRYHLEQALKELE